jgi:hypothetical protein
VLYEFNQDVFGARRVKKTDEMSFGSSTRYEIDRFKALFFETCDFRCDITGTVCHVVEAWTTRREKTAYGCLWVQGL